MRILLDHNAPVGLRRILAGHEVRTAFEMGWSTLNNGALLDAAEREGFQVMVTADNNIRHQQNLVGRRLAIIALDTPRWPTIRQHPAPIRQAVEQAEEGTYSVVSLPRPVLLRRAPPWRVD